MLGCNLHSECLQVTAKYDDKLYDLFCEAFCNLPLCHVINNKIFCVHGGLFAQDGVTLDDIRKTDRVTKIDIVSTSKFNLFLFLN